MIHGQILKGITLLLSQWLVGTWFFGLGNIAICIVGIIDAYKVGKVLQSGRAIKKWQWFPS